MLRVLIPTLGRTSLRHAVESAAQVAAVETVWVLPDGWNAYQATKRVLSGVELGARLAVCPMAGEPSGAWGNRQCNFFGQHAGDPADLVVWLSDDCELLPMSEGEYRAIDHMLQGFHGGIFGVEMETGEVLPGRHEIRCGTIDFMGLLCRVDTLAKVPYPKEPIYEGDWLHYGRLQAAGMRLRRINRTIGRRLP